MTRESPQPTRAPFTPPTVTQHASLSELTLVVCVSPCELPNGTAAIAASGDRTLV